ncbi:hypothetical protein BT93_L2401 [Corymbia citriodora subsp. variegata]|uniref:Pyridoxamine kinase/Phosphomethylpyrimidine kinase domain-containing protein n=1 Tax=Corymbia citriodora subsp. variegata TaxID=360336 RepID=A0A8T0CJP6_CORYI|nr:hypothetical protein BT93_L2401 [Corymbia citriodora subsp. variegata]
MAFSATLSGTVFFNLDTNRLRSSPPHPLISRAELRRRCGGPASSSRSGRIRSFGAMAAAAEGAERGAEMAKVPHVLTVAGSDSGAGAGIQADLKACAARGVYCSTVITAVTAQNTVGVQGVDNVSEEFVAEQLESVLSDMQVDVVSRK